MKSLRSQCVVEETRKQAFNCILVREQLGDQGERHTDCDRSKDGSFGWAGGYPYLWFWCVQIARLKASLVGKLIQAFRTSVR